MTITHHPEFESLMSCSAGSMPEAFAAVMASHIEVCPTCRKELALMQTIGSAIFESVVPVPMAQQVPGAVLGAAEAGSDRNVPIEIHGDVPRPIAGAVGHILDSIPWKRMSSGVWQHHIALHQPDRGELRLIKVAPGQTLPEHGHKGSEITLVLHGAYSDTTGRYAAGDVSDVGEDVAHAPVADPDEGCICLIATENRLQFKSRIARLVQPLVGI